jgi:hypothetical protein
MFENISLNLNAILHFKFSSRFFHVSKHSMIHPMDALQQTKDLRHSFDDQWSWLSLLPDPACIVDTKGNILAANDLFFKSFGKRQYRVTDMFDPLSQMKLKDVMTLSPGIRRAELFVPHCNKYFSWSFGIDALRKEILMTARYHSPTY